MRRREEGRKKRRKKVMGRKNRKRRRRKNGRLQGLFKEGHLKWVLFWQGSHLMLPLLVCR